MTMKSLTQTKTIIFGKTLLLLYIFEFKQVVIFKWELERKFLLRVEQRLKPMMNKTMIPCQELIIR